MGDGLRGDRRGDALPPLRRDHVERAALPWRSATFTECGLPTADHPVISRDEWLDRLRELGWQRASFVTCMTCADGARRNTTWAADPVRALFRASTDHRQRDLLAREMRALTLLVEAHRAEFDEALAGLDRVDDLTARRREVAARRQRGQR